MENQPKISTVEAMLLIMAAVIADIINWIPVVNWIVAVAVFPVTQIYFRMKGVKGIYGLAGNLAELLPVLSILPIYTFSFAATIYIDRHPKITEKIAPAIKVAKPAEKSAVPAVDGLKKA